MVVSSINLQRTDDESFKLTAPRTMEHYNFAAEQPLTPDDRKSSPIIEPLLSPESRVQVLSVPYRLDTTHTCNFRDNDSTTRGQFPGPDCPGNSGTNGKYRQQ